MTRDVHKPGMTLIELLVAITVASLVFAVAVSVYLTVTASLRRQQENHPGRADAALDQLCHDLTACAQVPSSNMPAFVLECPILQTNIPGLASLAFSIGSISGPDEDFSKLEIKRVRYSVVRGEDQSDSVLMRETMTLWGTDALAPAISNVVLEGVTAFDVGALSDSEWTNIWKSSGRTMLPRAVRIRLDWMAGTATETACVEVFIPAGNQVPGGGAGL